MRNKNIDKNTTIASTAALAGKNLDGVFKQLQKQVRVNGFYFDQRDRKKRRYFTNRELTYPR